MTFLPIVDRELREGSRRHATYWLRVRIAFLALLAGMVAYGINFFQPRAQLGMVMFWGLSGISMLYCLMAGRQATADCLSLEKREGTLGLLFLTDLKGHDVVLGKLISTSIAGFYAMVGIFPVLAIPLLAGGMSSGEFWRMVLVLLNTFFLSLAIGLLASSLSREYRTAMALNFAFALLVIFLPAGVGLAILAQPRHLFVQPLFYSCPIFSFIGCIDVWYLSWARHFWWSLAVTHILAWLFIGAACLIVPHTWSDKPPSRPARKWRWWDLAQLLNYGDREKCAAFRKRALDENAFYWLTGRARLKPAQVWALLILSVLWWFYGWLRSGRFMVEEITVIYTGLVLNGALKFWVASEAGQRFGEDRRSGAYELLLATPLTVEDMLRGQLLALRRQFLKPLILVTVLELILAVELKLNHWNDHVEFFACLGGICMLWADALALAWVAMAAALTSKNQTQAMATAVARIMLLPWGAFAMVMTFMGTLLLLEVIHRGPDDRFALGLWFGLGLGADLIFGLRARHVLKRDFRRLAMQSFFAGPSGSIWLYYAQSAALWAKNLTGRIFGLRAAKPILASVACILVVGTAFMVYRGRSSGYKPLLISITQSNAPMKVFSAGNSGVFVILPDQSLWRWGKTGAPQAPRATTLERVGDGHDWLKVVSAGTHCLGLRTDGTIWGWGYSNGRNGPEPQLAAQGQDWIDLDTGPHYAAAVTKSGSLVVWNEPLVVNGGKVQFNRENQGNWVAVCCWADTIISLRRDGSLWFSGTMAKKGSRGRSFWRPTPLCEETNWVSLEPNEFARNSAGELWNIQQVEPYPTTKSSKDGVLFGSSPGSDHVHSLSEWLRLEIRKDGTLWQMRSVTSLPMSFPAGVWDQVGHRTDWVEAWGEGGTGFGQTADGTLWTWGFAFDQDTSKTLESRLDSLRKRMAGGPGLPFKTPHPYMAEPRPLLKFVMAQAR